MSEAAAENSLLEEARSLIDLATSRGVVLRLVGGLAVHVLCPDLPPRSRTGQDLDFCSIASSRPGLQQMLAERGYAADKTFNALYGNKQLYFTHTETGLALDVMVDKLEMCHTLDFGSRVANLPYTLEPLDVLLSKLQIVELNAKDADDCLRLLVTYPLADRAEPGAMDLSFFRGLVGDDWGWWRTVTLNLEKIRLLLDDQERQTLVAAGALDPDVQLAALTRAAEDAPKTRRWKLRAKVGERKRWYEQPEETPH